MTEELKQIIKEEVGKLPKEAQEAINSLDWAKITEEIGKKNSLTESEINDFQVETLLVLTGLQLGSDYARHIENNVSTGKEEAERMAEEANEKIFTPISSVLEKNIKKTLQSKNPNAVQNINFILSGGDYFSFIEPSNSASDAQETVLTVFPIKRKV